MNITSKEALIGFDEGDKGQPYQDSRGIWTIGRGHNLEANGIPAGVCADAPEGVVYPACMVFLGKRGGITPTEDAALFAIDLEANCSWLHLKPWWSATNLPRQAALSDMAFNLGPASMQTFTTFLGLVAAGDWAAAADDLEFKTKVATQLPARYHRLEAILRDGAWPS